MIKRFLQLQLLLILLLAALPGSAQVKCGSDEKREKLEMEEPGYRQLIEQMDKGIRDFIAANPDMGAKVGDISAPVYFIPCVVQVIHNGGAIGAADNPTDAQILAAIDYINKVYDGTWAGAGGTILGAGDLQIKLVLATKDPNNNASSGIVRTNGSGLAGYSANGANANGSSGATEISVKNLSRWDPFKYYNIWLVHKIDGCTGIFCGCACDAGFIAGYAYFPPANNASSNTRDLDGTLMLSSQFQAGEKTLPHEIGHALNLYHPFQGNGAPANNCPGAPGDQCADTDPVTNPQLAPNAFPFACRNQAPYSPPYTNPCTTTPFTDNTERNFMNYTNCYRLFTNDQRSRMQASLLTTSRASLNTSWANNQGAYPTVFTAPMAPAITPSSTLTSPNVAGITNITLNNRVVYSLNASRDGGYLNNANKWYDLFELTANTNYTMVVTLGVSGNAEQLGVWIDYNNDGSFNTGNEQLYINTDIPAATGAAGISINFTVPPNASINTGQVVRMRLTEDLSTLFSGVPDVTNVSASLVYGQAEDYPVYLQAAPLPLNLLSFTGKRITDAVQLNWKTEQEQNTKEFDIERSTNGVNFNRIGTVAATGLSSGSEYQFKDVHVTNGEYFYRLKMKDVDGAFSYSQVIRFIISTKGMVVKRNPFKHEIKILFPSASGEASFRLLDAKGRLIFKSNVIVSYNEVTLTIPEKQLSAGIYILEAILNGERFTEKLIRE